MDSDLRNYKTISQFAIDPIYADLDEFINMGLLSTAEIFKLDEEAEKKFDAHDKELIKTEKLKRLGLYIKELIKTLLKKPYIKNLLKKTSIG